MEICTLILHAYTCGEPKNVWQALKKNQWNHVDRVMLRVFVVYLLELTD